MTTSQTFLQKLSAIFSGQSGAEPPAPQPHTGLTLKLMDQKLNAVLAHLRQETHQRPAPPSGSVLPASPEGDELTEQVKKLAKTQFKANILQESQLTQQQETVEVLRQSLEAQLKQQADTPQQVQKAVESARISLFTSLLPVVDGLDAAFNSGRRQVLTLTLNRQDRRQIIAWLDGVRLTRLRLLGVLEANHIAPIPGVGHPFNPLYHIAVATDTGGKVPDGIIVAEDRTGYMMNNTVIRFAEVVVAQRN